MKRLFLLWCFCTVVAAAWPQQVAGSPVCPSPDSAALATDSLLVPRQVQRELLLLQDRVDDWQPFLRRHGHGRWHSWRVGVDATTFLRDAAFSLPYTRGYTATGFFLAPFAQRAVGADARVTLGLLLSGVAGYDGLRAWQPLVRLEYEPFRNFRLVMGSIFGTLAHGLYEPMLDRERFIYDHQEEGVQILSRYWLGNRLHWSMDTWLHWEELLEPWQPRQERFTLGSSHLLTLFAAPLSSCSSRSLSVSLPLSFLGSHRGGQFSSLDTCIQSLFNESVGLRVNLPTGSRSALALDVPVFFFQDISPTKCLPYHSGWGLWPQLSVDWQFASGSSPSPLAPRPFWRGSWRLLAQAGYWRGHQFIAPRGSYLFQCVSWHRPDFSVPERKMATAKLAFENRYNHCLSLGLDTEYYYDMVEKAMDFAFGLYLRYAVPSIK